MNNCNAVNYLISVISPAYNAELYIGQMIESVISQTYSNWEMIIINDASSDNTEKIIKRYCNKDNRIKLISLSKNLGAANARNIGLANTRNRFITFLDSDDFWLENKLATQLQFMIDKKISFSFMQYRRFSQNNGQLSKVIDVPEQIDYKQLLEGNVINCSTVMFDRDYISEICMPIGIHHEDYITWLQILKKGHYAYGIKKDLVRYRIYPGSTSYNKRQSAIWTWNVYRNVENLSLFHSIYYYCLYSINSIKKHYL